MTPSWKTFHGQTMSLPEEERRIFEDYQHPCQDKQVTGFVVARRCAETLCEKLTDHPNFKLVAPAFSSDGFFLRVVVTAKIETLEPFYRGFLVRQSVLP
jgi:hypothetical protein